MMSYTNPVLSASQGCLQISNANLQNFNDRWLLSHHSILHLISHTSMCILPKKARENMPTNLAIDDKLLEAAKRIGKHRTKKGVVTEALIEYIQRREQLKILRSFGTIDYDKDYDYKVQRNAN